MSALHQPPCTLTPVIVTLVARIAEAVGQLSVRLESARDLRLRRINRIRTIHGSLAIEGNTLSEAQITAILDGTRSSPRRARSGRCVMPWQGLRFAFHLESSARGGSPRCASHPDERPGGRCRCLAPGGRGCDGRRAGDPHGAAGGRGTPIDGESAALAGGQRCAPADCQFGLSL